MLEAVLELGQLLRAAALFRPARRLWWLSAAILPGDHIDAAARNQLAQAKVTQSHVTIGGEEDVCGHGRRVRRWAVGGGRWAGGGGGGGRLVVGGARGWCAHWPA